MQLAGQYLGGGFKAGDQLELLGTAWSYLAVATEKFDAPDDFSEWSRRIVERSKLQFDWPQYELIPFNAARRIATTCHEGCVKYGPNNWLKGFPCTDLCNHFMKHMLKWCNGDRKEDHMGHANWGFMTCSHMMLHRPDMTADLLGPCYSITSRLQDILDNHPAHKKPPELNAEFVEREFDSRTDYPIGLKKSSPIDQPKICTVR